MKKRILACLMTGCAALASAGAASVPAFTLSKATIVTEDGLSGSAKVDWAKQAIEDFQMALSKTCGTEIPCKAEAEAEGILPAIYIGETRAARKAGLDAGELTPAEFRIKVERNRAFILANTGLAISLGTAEFLKRFADYRFVTATGDDPYTADPARRAVVCDFRKGRVIRSMHNSHWSSRFPEGNTMRQKWFRRMRGTSYGGDLGGEYHASQIPGWCHTQMKYCPPEKYFKDHPEYYSVRTDGRRHGALSDGAQLCFSNPDVFKVVYDSLVSFIEEDRRNYPSNPPRIYDFTHMDNSPFLCKCPECAKLIARYDREGTFDKGGDAGLQLWFVNRLAREIAKKYPDVMLRVFAYVSTEEPPKGIVPEDNVIIWLCDLYSKCDHELPLTHPFNAPRLEIFRQWCKIAKHVEVWDYTLYEPDFPEVFADATAADARLMRDLGIDRVYIENHYRYQPFYELNTYLQSELYFDPDQDVDELIRGYCRVYGKGADAMFRAIGFLRKTILENPPVSTYAWHSRVLPWRTAANWNKFATFVREAYKAEKPGIERARIAAVMASTLRELARIHRYTPGDEARYAKVKAAYPRFAREGLDGSPVFGKDRARAEKDIADCIALLELEFKDLPDGFENVPRDELIFLDYRKTGYEPSCALRVEDSVSETGHAVRWKPFHDDKLPLRGWIVGDGMESVRLSVPDLPADGKYHWVKVAALRIARNTRVAFGNKMTFLTFYAQDAYLECDGLEKDPNWYEIWLSARISGSYDATDEKDGFFADRMILRRIEGKKGK